MKQQIKGQMQILGSIASILVFATEYYGPCGKLFFAGCKTTSGMAVLQKGESRTVAPRRTQPSPKTTV
jgi:hypothetical protein